MGSKSDPPPTPDYVGAAREEGATGRDNLNLQTWANRPTVNTPWGRQSWDTSSAIDPSTGRPVTQWQSNIELSPAQQSALDSQMRISQMRSAGAERVLGNTLGQLTRSPDFSNLGEGGTSVDPSQFQSRRFSAEDSQAARERAQEATWSLQLPQLESRRSALESQLLNQGISRGSAAWDAGMREQGDLETRARLAAIEAGRAETDLGMRSNQAYNQGVEQDFSRFLRGGQYNDTLRAGNLSELQQMRAFALNEANALQSGQNVAMPQMPSFSMSGVAPGADLTGAMNASYRGAMDQHNADQADAASQQQAAATMAMMAMLYFSDKRLKKNVEKIGETPEGRNVYMWDWNKKAENLGADDQIPIGVMAQENPDISVEGSDGYQRVAYGFLS